MLLFATVLLAMHAGSALCATSDIALKPFTGIQACSLFKFVVTPGTSYSVNINADQAVVDAIDAVVTSSQLRLGTKKPFSTDKPIQLTITVPANKMESISGKPLAQVYIDGGAVSPAFNISSTGAGGITMINANVTDLSIFNYGMGRVIVNGSIADAFVQSTGNGDVYLDGVDGTVHAFLTGGVDLYIKPSGDAAEVVGENNGFGKVFITPNMDCSIKARNDLGVAVHQAGHRFAHCRTGTLIWLWPN